MVKVRGVPEQLCPAFVNVGVTVTVAVMGEVPPLAAVKAGSGPLPLGPNPMAVLLLLQA